MRLIKVNACQLEEPYEVVIVDTADITESDDELVSYSIISHRWAAEEVTFENLERNDWSCKRGAANLLNVMKLPKKRGDEYLWMDTCCIDKRSSSELSEAIISMFR